MNAAHWMPIAFLGLMGLAMLLYVVLDGYDLGVGMLLRHADDDEKDLMIGSLGPFWDANETWLVLGIGILLIAFPKAHGVVMGALYLPVAFMLIGLILRGVAFDFRVKAPTGHKRLWTRAFFAGSLIAAVSQGWMLGRYITGFADGWAFDLFAAAIAVTLPAAYVLLGACWLILKTEGELQKRAVTWAKRAWPAMVLGVGLVSVATPIVSPTVAERWFTLPGFIGLLPIPLSTAAALLGVRALLNSHRILGKLCWLPFTLVIGVFVMGALGLAYSLYPFVVMDRMTVWQAASAPASLAVILVGCAVAVPAIGGYTIYSYRVFGGKATVPSYA
ncbi:cytochrome d ubiquinol oxidase subunit II [Aquincola sp. S2]|uniref:Cytochrome d ubiquinol oxidase subunit II n=1 Tax=Pseudaquabacterium terrae TaxID=2732868 RepID=A0ABX2EM67_9BURK|nr:cytochrome d ubiquinol oxidase subunit II [Aquabacterium terrae]NRF69725.1 cytochrome d ubiquinol oxidase subunit II [Aquabacterium terrae]